MHRRVPLCISKFRLSKEKAKNFSFKGQKETGTVYRFHRLAIIYNTCRHERQDSVHKNL